MSCLLRSPTNANVSHSGEDGRDHTVAARWQKQPADSTTLRGGTSELRWIWLLPLSEARCRMPSRLLSHTRTRRMMSVVTGFAVSLVNRAIDKSEGPKISLYTPERQGDQSETVEVRGDNRDTRQCARPCAQRVAMQGRRGCLRAQRKRGARLKDPLPSMRSKRCYLPTSAALEHFSRTLQWDIVCPTTEG